MKDVRMADVLPWVGGVVTMILGHFLSRRRNSEQEKVAAEQRATEREEERKEAAHQRLLDELERQKDKTLFWRDRAQSYRAEAMALRILAPVNTVPLTPDHEEEP